MDAVQRFREEQQQQEEEIGGDPEEDPEDEDEAVSRAALRAVASHESGLDEVDAAAPDERLLLPAVTFAVAEPQPFDEKRRRSGSASGSLSRRKRSARPRPLDGGRYLLSSLASPGRRPDPADAPCAPAVEGEAFPPHEALVGVLTQTRVAAFVRSQLERVAAAVQGMCASLASMKEGCHPFIFYHRVRPFLSAWKQVSHSTLHPAS